MQTEFPINLITGVEQLDLQHMEFIARIKSLHESFVGGNNSEKLLETYQYVKFYINEHFLLEENYMLHKNYPDFENHIKAHRAFSRDFEALERIFKKEGASSHFNLDFNVQIINWLKTHILKMDMALAEFIREKQANFEHAQTKDR